MHELLYAAAAQPYVAPSPMASFVSVMAWAGPLLLLLGAVTWAWPLVSRHVNGRVGGPKGHWDRFFNGDRVEPAADADAETTTADAAATAGAPAHLHEAALPVGVDEDIYDDHPTES